MNGILVPLNSLEAPMVDEILHGGAEMLFIIKRGIDRWYAFRFCNVSGCEKTYEWQKKLW